MKDVLVFFGGVSQEHDISIISGVFALNCIDKTNFNAIPIYVSKSGEWFSGEVLNNIEFYKKPDYKKLRKVTLLSGDNCLYWVKKNKLIKLEAIAAALNVMHGANGEDGALCGILQLSKIPLASPNSFCSALAIDKHLTKIVLSSLGIKTVPSITFLRRDFYCDRDFAMLDAVNDFGYPLIVKPVSSGSSIGINVANDFDELENALEVAFRYDEKAIVEKFLKNGVDINCAAYSVRDGVIVSECEKPVTKNAILTFSDKYLNVKNGQSREFPAKISEKFSQEIKETTKDVYQKFGFCGIVRFDYLFCDNQVYLNEINSVPGSLAYYLFCDKISEFTDVLTMVLLQAMGQFVAKQNVEKTFECADILNGIKGIKK